MHRLRSPKVCASLVMIAWLASLIALWGMTSAGSAAIKDGSCNSKDLQNKGLQLEMADSPAKALPVLNGDSKKAGCIRAGVAAQVEADYLFIPAYSALSLALFLFVRAIRLASRGEEGTVLLILAVLLVLAMVGGDVTENRQLTPIIELAGKAQPPENLIGERLPLLRAASYVKMGALALAAAILGALWTSASGSRLVWLPRLLGLATAALFLSGMIGESWQLAAAGMAAFAAFGIAGLIHAIAVAVGRGETSDLQVKKV